ncbi:MAG: BMP family protein, partial [Acidimicrobiia bacterium]
RAVLRISPTNDTTVAIIIDQFEELFTITDPATTQRFLTALNNAADDPRGRIHIIVTLRADFYDRPLRHAAFGSAMSKGVVNIVPMAPEELEQAASQPATKAGVRLEPGLEAALIGDVLGQPGALPLFQFALTDLFSRRVGETLTLASYRDIGGVDGSVGRKAEQIYEKLTPDQQTTTPQLFLRLVSITDTATRSRRRVEANELLDLDIDVTDLQTVIDMFGKDRLLSFDRNDTTGSPTVEVAHEALLQHWERLSTWIDEGTEDVRRNVLLTAAAIEWASNDHDPGYLLTGARLDSYQEWADASTMALARGERDFLTASAAARDEQTASEISRVAREVRAAKRAKRNARSVVGVTVLVAVVGAFFVWSALKPEGPTIALLHSNVGNIDAMIVSGFDDAQRDFPFVAKLYEPDFSLPVDVQLGQIADAGADLIFVGLYVGPFDLDSLATAYPNTVFAVPSVGIDEGSPSNITSSKFADAEGSYLMGAIAALKSESDHIGIVGAAQTWGISEFFGSFDAGARSINPDIEVSIDWAAQESSEGGTGFNQPELVFEAALNMYKNGADVVFNVAGDGGVGGLEAAADYSNETGRRVWGIGVDIDDGFAADSDLAPFVLTSMLKRFDTEIYNTIETYLNGTLEPATVYGLDNDGIAYANFGGNVDDIAIEIEAARQRVITGEAELPIVSALPSAFRSTASQNIDIEFDGERCTSSAIGPVSEGDVLSFTFVNSTDDEANILLLSAPDNPTLERLNEEPYAIWTSGAVLHAGWPVPPRSTYEIRAEFEAEPLGTGVVGCSNFPGDTLTFATVFPVSGDG